MLAIPRRINNVYHPLIEEIYLKKEPDETVLVLETQPDAPQQDKQSNSNVDNVLVDLKNLEEQAKDNGAEFDRVDIRTALSDESNPLYI